MEPQSFEFCLFDGKFDNKPKHLSRDIDLIGQSLTKPVPGVGKDNLPLWSPAIYKKRSTRKKSGVEQITMLVYDMDCGNAPVDSWRLFSDWTVICHTSYSHSPAHHKYRIILPLEKPIPASDWNRAAKAATDLWIDIVGRGEPDQKALKDPSRMYYRYSIPDCSDFTVSDPMNPRAYHQAHFHQSFDADGVDKYLSLEYQHIEEPKPPVAVYRDRKGRININDAHLDTAWRQAAAQKLGARIYENEARFIKCPDCGKNSVHFAISLNYAGVTKWAKCNHENTCQYWGSVADLLGVS
jgi:hypothetical protein